MLIEVREINTTSEVTPINGYSSAIKFHQLDEFGCDFQLTGETASRDGDSIMLMKL
jgi:hypothetical protein